MLSRTSGITVGILWVKSCVTRKQPFTIFLALSLTQFDIKRELDKNYWKCKKKDQFNQETRPDVWTKVNDKPEFVLTQD